MTQKEKEDGIGPADIPRQPGEDRLPTSDELPVEERKAHDDAERPSRTGAHDVNADRRRSHAPYAGEERRAR
jgi:hypothetical protein